MLQTKTIIVFLQTFYYMHVSLLLVELGNIEYH